MRAGARVIAPVRARRTQGWADAAGETELPGIAEALWGPEPQPVQGERRVGAGLVLWGEEAAVHLSRLGIGRDGAGAPQAWDPATGQRYALPGARKVAGGTLAPLRLEGFGSVCVVFGAATGPALAALPLVGEMDVWRTLDGPWRIRFDPRWGGPGAIALPGLASWTTHALDGVRHYSGTVVYTKDIDLPRLPAGPVWIDLGQVEVVATVLINGHEVTRCGRRLTRRTVAATCGRAGTGSRSASRTCGRTA